MTNLLCVHLIPAHLRTSDFDYIRRVDPFFVKIINPDSEIVRRVRQAAPRARIWLRDHPLSEQHDDVHRDPEGTGRRHADEWAKMVRERYSDVPRDLLMVSGLNEPHVWTDFSVVPYTVEFLDRLAQYGLRGAALNLSVGWPANSGPDTPPDWRHYEPVRDAIRRGNHVLCVHEYWNHEGPGRNWGWWAGRLSHCPWDVPIWIGECGIDEYVADGSHPFEKRGWRAWVGPGEYAAQVEDFLLRTAEDPRVEGACLFTTDFGGGEWKSFDTNDAHSALAGIRVQKGTRPAGGTSTGPSTPPPARPEEGDRPAPAFAHPCPGAALTQHWGENAANYAPFGLWGHNGTDLAAPAGTPVRAVAPGIVEWTDSDRDYGLYVRLRHAALECDSFYAHLQAVAVGQGDAVQAGQVIGQMGSTGNSTGPHLHLEIRLLAGDQYEPAAPMAKGRIDPESWGACHGLRLAP